MVELLAQLVRGPFSGSFEIISVTESDSDLDNISLARIGLLEPFSDACNIILALSLSHRTSNSVE